MKLLRRLGVALFSALLIFTALGVYFWKTQGPRSYPRPYREAPGSSAGATLAELATSRGFWVGAAVSETVPEAYARLVPREFNSVTPENALKWPRLLREGRLGDYDFSTADPMVDYAVENGVRVRGHGLVWATNVQGGYPAALGSLIEADPSGASVREALKEHITVVMEHFRDRIHTWDVINEPVMVEPEEKWFGMLIKSLDNPIQRALGDDYLAVVFRMAHEADPKAELFLNEALGDYRGEKSRLLLQMVDGLLVEGVPLHGVGLQGHNVRFPHDPVALREYIQQLADRGLKVELTEVDVRLRLFEAAEDPYEAQGRHVRALAEACVSVPACQGLTFWGLRDGATWLDWVPPYRWMTPNDPVLFDAELARKPAYEGLREALGQRSVPAPEPEKGSTVSPGSEGDRQ